jgi:DNA-binding transcriptional LysR family regulator
MHNMNWDDLRFILAVANTGALNRAASTLGVDHTTVGRRVAAAERALKVTLFTRTPGGYAPTRQAQRLLAPMREVEAAVLSVERGASADRATLEGTVRLTAPESLGIGYLAARLERFHRRYPGLTVELLPSGQVLDLGRRQAEVAVRFFRSLKERLAVRRVARVGYGLYASHAYLARRPVRSLAGLKDHPLLAPARDPSAADAAWLEKICPRVRPALVSPVSLALAAAARASAGVAVLPCYLGDADAALERIAAPGAPQETVWLTVHRDLRQSPPVRALLDDLVESFTADAALLEGRAQGA